jgi:hypothetical protein
MRLIFEEAAGRRRTYNRLYGGSWPPALKAKRTRSGWILDAVEQCLHRPEVREANWLAPQPRPVGHLTVES